MSNLYSKDEKANKENIQCEIMQRITNRKKHDLQKIINRYINLRAYQCHRDDPLQYFVNRVNKSAPKYMDFNDIHEEEFVASFTGNYQERIYEVSQAEFLDKNHFELVSREKTAASKNKGLPDYMFRHNSKTYLFECLTTNTSLIDVFIDALPEFEILLSAAKIFHNKCEQLQNTESCWKYSHWSSVAEQLWYRLDKQQHRNIINYFNEISAYCAEMKLISSSLTPRWIVKKLDEWLYLNQYAYFYLRELLPPTLENSLALILPKTRSENMPKFIDFLVTRIVKMVLGKLDKNYFDQKTPVILSLSLATLPDHMLTTLAVNQFENISQRIWEQLKIEGTKGTKKMTAQQLSFRIKNLYAIIIDTTWFNWFPDIVEKYHQAKFPDGYKNCYFVIYNTNLSSDLQYDHHIFEDSIKNGIDFHLEINTEIFISNDTKSYSIEDEATN